MPIVRDPNAPKNRISVDLSEDETSFVDRYSSYLNALATFQKGEELNVKWKRKLTAENLLSNSIVAQRNEMKLMFKALGDLPRTEEEMSEYVKRASAWLSKRAK